MNKNELIREHSLKKMFSFGHCPIYLYLIYPPSPQFGQLDQLDQQATMITTMMIIVILILVFLMILVLKITKKVSNNMILMSKYKGKHGGKKGQKIRARSSPPPLFGQCPKENIFFFRRASLNLTITTRS